MHKTVIIASNFACYYWSQQDYNDCCPYAGLIHYNYFNNTKTELKKNIEILLLLLASILIILHSRRRFFRNENTFSRSSLPSRWFCLGCGWFSRHFTWPQAIQSCRNRLYRSIIIEYVLCFFFKKKFSHIKKKTRFTLMLHISLCCLGSTNRKRPSKVRKW